MEFTGQYISAGGPGSPYLINQLLAYETNGTFPGSPDNFSGGTGWNTKWHGIAPAAWVYLALSPDILARLSLPLANYDFESAQSWGMFEELVDPSCYVTGAGEVVQSTDVAAAGTTSLRVTANKGKTASKSNPFLNKRADAIEVQRAAEQPVGRNTLDHLDERLDDEHIGFRILSERVLLAVDARQIEIRWRQASSPQALPAFSTLPTPTIQTQAGGGSGPRSVRALRPGGIRRRSRRP